MEFRFRAGEKGPPSFLLPATAADGYLRKCLDPYASLATGFLGVAGEARPNMARPITLMDPLQRAIEKELIREEIYAREMVERRILEEEVRREMEMERLSAMRRFQEQKMVVSFDSEPRHRDEHDPRLLLAPPVGELDEVRARGTPSMSMMEKTSSLPTQKLDHGNSNSSPLPEVSPTDKKVSGKKRKAATNSASSKALKLVDKDWSCALCQVIATSETALNDHLQGKKHRAKVAALESKTTGAKKSAGNSSSHSSKAKMAVAKEEGNSNNVPKMVKIQVDGKMHQVLQTGFALWCERCKVECNSSTMMVSHLTGKKHNALVMESEKNPRPSGAETCDKGLMEKDLAAEAAKEDIANEEEKGIVKKGEDKLLNSIEVATGEV